MLWPVFPHHWTETLTLLCFCTAPLKTHATHIMACCCWKTNTYVTASRGKTLFTELPVKKCCLDIKRKGVRKELSDVKKNVFDCVLSSGISGRQRGSATTETWSRMMPLSQQENLWKSSSTSLKPQAVALGSPCWWESRNADCRILVSTALTVFSKFLFTFYRCSAPLPSRSRQCVLLEKGDMERCGLADGGGRR